jgi:hypothetical protein
VSLATSGLGGLPTDEGGAVIADVLRLVDVELRGNAAVAGGAVSTIDLHAVRTSFVDNTARGDPARGGAVYAFGQVTLENVTFASNLADDGGALWMDGTPSGDEGLTATFVTFSDNSATTAGSGADLHVDAQQAADFTMVLRGVVFASVAGGSVGSCGGSYPFVSATRTATFGVDGSCGVTGEGIIAPPVFSRVPFLTGMSDLYAPSGGSPLLDAVACDGSWPTGDQRGVLRPQGDDGRCDAGAVELVRTSEDPENVDEEGEGEDEGQDDDDASDGSDGSGAASGEGTVGGGGANPRLIPTRIPAGDGGCADGCGPLSGAVGRALQR